MEAVFVSIGSAVYLTPLRLSAFPLVAFSTDEPPEACAVSYTERYIISDNLPMETSDSFEFPFSIMSDNLSDTVSDKFSEN